MGPQESTRERAGEAAELGEPGLQLTHHAPSEAGEEPADAEASGATGGGKCWLCRSSPCCSRADPEAKKKAPCPGLGLFYTLLSAFLFSVGSLFVKKVQDVDAVEISAFRCVFQMLVIIPCLIYRNHIAMRKPSQMERPTQRGMEVTSPWTHLHSSTACTNLPIMFMLGVDPSALRYKEMNCHGLHPKDHKSRKGLNEAQGSGTTPTRKCAAKPTAP